MAMAVPLNPISRKARGKGDKRDQHGSKREAGDNDGHGGRFHSLPIGAINRALEVRLAPCTPKATLWASERAAQRLRWRLGRTSRR